uniref:Uncharacterized protein n=1 Tax=Oryza sativa subsp. japonica TaxID=39947 RepID=Q8H5M4_ORYSJ|nr:hypothetical protein [Oryza sativa Japonica Group]BAD30171.1 hypothetical protein [Oryza sativa Japonica Group]
MRCAMINHRLFDHARARVQSAHLLTVNTVPSPLLAALPNVRRCHLPNGEKKTPPKRSRCLHVSTSHRAKAATPMPITPYYYSSGGSNARGRGPSRSGARAAAAATWHGEEQTNGKKGDSLLPQPPKVKPPGAWCWWPAAHAMAP